MEAIHDFKEVLTKELEQRINRNPRYSLRAFAKDLSVPAPLLSDILNGKRGLSRISGRKIAKKLGLSKEATSVFCDLIEAKHARSKLARNQAQARMQKRLVKGEVLDFLVLDTDRFAVVANWYHFAVFELLKSPVCISEPQWIAKKLGIQTLQAKSALERMEKLKIIKNDQGRYTVASENIQTPDGLSLQALKSHHEQFIKKGIEALYTQPVGERDFRGLTIRCAKADVPRVRNRIRDFLQSLDAELSANQSGEEVYQLSTQFFRLTQN